MNRLSALRIGAGAAAIPWMQQPADAQAPQQTIKLGVTLFEGAAQAFYGVDTGRFAQHGLAMELTTFTSGSESAAAIASGAIDIGLMDMVTIINGHNRGLPFIYLAPGLIYRPSDHNYGVVVPENSPIREAKDFKDKTLAATALNNISILPVKAWLDNNGADSRTIHWAEMPMGVMGNAVEKLSVQGALISEPFLSPVLGQGNRVFFMEEKPLTAAFLYGGWATTTTWANANKAAAGRFAAAMVDIAKWANGNFPLAAPILSKYSKIPLALVQNMRHGEFAETLRPDLMNPVMNAALKYGMSDKTFPIGEVVFKA